MSDAINAAAAASVASASPAANTPAPTSDGAVDNAALDAADLADEAAETAAANPADPKAPKTPKLDPKKAKELEKRIKKLKLKVDGKEIEESIDWDNEEELVRHLQMSKMGQKRAQEKADLEKQVQNFFKAFEKDPFDAMKQLGMDPNKNIDDYINRQLENAKKSPEQLAKEQLQAELQKLKTERDQEKEEFKTKELARLQEQAFTKYDMEMEQTLSKSNLPKTPYTVKKMADYMLAALEAGKDVSPADVVGLVEEEMNSDLKEMFASLPEEQVEALLGEQVLNKLRKRRIAKAQTAGAAVGKPNIQDTGKSANTEGKPKSKSSYKDFFKM